MATPTVGSAGVKITPDMTDFFKKLEARLRAADAEFDVKVDADTAAAEAKIKALGRSETIDVTADADTAVAAAKIAAVARDREVNLKVDANTGGAVAKLAGLTLGADGASRSFKGLSDGLSLVGSQASSASSGMSSFGTSAGGVAASLPGLAVSAGLVSTAIIGITAAAGLAGGAIGSLGAAAGSLTAGAVPGIAAVALGLDGIKEAAQAAAPAFDQLKQTMSSTFATELAPAFAQIGTMLEQITPQMQNVASGVSTMFSGVIAGVAANVGNLQAALDGSADMFRGMTAGATEFANSLINMGAVAAPFMQSIGQGFGEMAAQIGRAFDNLARTGELQTLFASIQPMLTGLGDGLRQIVEAFGTMGAIVGPVLGPLFSSFGAGIQAMAAPLAELGATLGEALIPLFPVLGEMIGAFSVAIQPTVAALGQILTVVGDGLTQAFQALAPAMGPLAEAFASIFTAIAPMLPVLGEMAAVMATAIAPVFSALATAIAPVAEAFAAALVPPLQMLVPILQQLAPAFQMMGTQLGTVLTMAITAIAPLLPLLVDLFAQMVAAIMPLVPQLFQLGMQLFPALMNVIIQLIPIIIALLPAVTMAIQMFASWMSSMMPVINVIVQVITWTANLLAAILGFAAQALGAIVRFSTGVISGFSSMISTVIGAVSGWVSSLLGKFSQLVSSGVAKARELWSNVQNAFSNGVSQAISKVSEMPSRIMSFFADAGSWLVNAGKNIVQGLINGITSALSSAYETVRNMASEIGNVARDALGIASPSRVFMEIGGFVSEGLAIGIENGSKQPSKSISDAVGGIAGTAVKHVADQFGLNQAQVTAGAVQQSRGGKSIAMAMNEPGLFSGVGGPRSDSNIIRISNGEFVMNEKATKRNLPLLDAMNRGRKIPGFADGMRAKVTEAQLDNFARGLEGKPYVWGGVNWGDCSGAMSALARFCAGLPPFAGRFATSNEGPELAKLGFENGRWQKGFFAIGWKNGGPAGGHTAGTLPNGTNVEMGGGRGNGQYGGGAAGSNDPYFNTGFMRIKVAEPYKPHIPEQGAILPNGTVPGAIAATTTAAPGISAATTQKPKTWSELAGTTAKDVVAGQTKSLLGIFGIPDELPPFLQAKQMLDSNMTDEDWTVANLQAKIAQADAKMQLNGRLIAESESALNKVRNSPAGDPLISAVQEAQKRIDELKAEMEAAEKAKEEAEKKLKEITDKRKEAAEAAKNATAVNQGASATQLAGVAQHPLVAAVPMPEPPKKHREQLASQYDSSKRTEQWTPIIHKVLKEKRESVPVNTPKAIRRGNQESNGNPKAQNNWDSNAARGTPSKGVWQTIDPTFQSNKDRGYDNIWEPEDNFRASVNYTKKTYGSLAAGWDRAGGYNNGGFVFGPGGKRTDSIPAFLSKMEHVTNARSAMAAPQLLAAINGNPEFAKAVNTAFVSDGAQSQAGTTNFSSSNSFVVADVDSAFRRSRFENERNQITYAGVR